MDLLTHFPETIRSSSTSMEEEILLRESIIRETLAKLMATMPQAPQAEQGSPSLGNVASSLFANAAAGTPALQHTVAASPRVQQQAASAPAACTSGRTTMPQGQQHQQQQQSVVNNNNNNLLQLQARLLQQQQTAANNCTNNAFAGVSLPSQAMPMPPQQNGNNALDSRLMLNFYLQYLNQHQQKQNAIQQHLWQFQQQQQQQLNNNNINFKQYNGINNVNNSNNNVPQGANNKSRAGRVQSKERGTTAGKQTTTKRRSSCHSHGSTSAPSLSSQPSNHYHNTNGVIVGGAAEPKKQEKDKKKYNSGGDGEQQRREVTSGSRRNVPKKQRRVSTTELGPLDGSVPLCSASSGGSATTTASSMSPRVQMAMAPAKWVSPVNGAIETGSGSGNPGSLSQQQQCSVSPSSEAQFSSGGSIASPMEQDGEPKTSFLCEWQIGDDNGQWHDCGEVFGQEEPFVDHVNEHVRGEQTPSFFCRWSSCKRREAFNAQYMLAQHVRKHSGEKPYQCDFVNPVDGVRCTKRYSRLENKKTHERTHNGERPYQCAHCPKTFTNASDKAKHQNRTHKKTKDFHCPVQSCNKEYTDPSSLRKHVVNEHGDNVWQFARQNKEDKGAKTYGLNLIGIRHTADGRPEPYLIPQAQVPTSSSDEDREVCNNNNATTKVRQPHTSSDEDREVDVMSTTPPPPPTQASTSAENAGVGVASPGVGGATFGVGGPSAGHLQQPRQQHFKQELTSPPMSQQPAPPQQPQANLNGNMMDQAMATQLRYMKLESHNHIAMDLPSRAGARNPALSSSSSIKGEYPSPVEFFDMQTQRFPSDRISSMERSPEDPAPSSTVYPQHSHYGELGYGSVGYGSGYGGGGGVAEMEYGRVVQHRMHQPLYGYHYAGHNQPQAMNKQYSVVEQQQQPQQIQYDGVTNRVQYPTPMAATQPQQQQCHRHVGGVPATQQEYLQYAAPQAPSTVGWYQPMRASGEVQQQHQVGTVPPTPQQPQPIQYPHRQQQQQPQYYCTSQPPAGIPMMVPSQQQHYPTVPTVPPPPPPSHIPYPQQHDRHQQQQQQVLPQQPVHEQAENEEEQDDDEEGDDMSSVSNEFSGLSVYDQPPGRGPK